MEKSEKTIAEYRPLDEREEADRTQILQYLASGHDALSREDAAAHFTCSAWITDSTRSRVLFAFHNIYKSWAWIGGHADGNPDFLAVALKEAREETGVRNFRVLSENPISIETLAVKSHVKHGKIVSSHLHFNVTYLLEADPEDELTVKKDENSAVGWRTEEQILSPDSEPEMLPIYSKLLDRMKNY